MFTADVMIALVTGMATVMVAGFGFLGVLVSRTHGNVKATRKLASEAKEQVTNNHAANFRDEVTGIGDMAGEIKEGMSKITATLAEHGMSFLDVQSTLDKQNTSLKDLHGKVSKQGTNISELTASDKAQWNRMENAGLGEHRTKEQ